MHNNKKKNSSLRKRDQQPATMGTATADVLPECLIQEILCYLSYEEASRMSILSKTWLQAWFTLPILKFTDEYLRENMDIVDDIMERYRNRNIPIDKFELLTPRHNRLDFFPVNIDKWVETALQNGVKDLVFRDTFELYSFPIFKILGAKSLRELVLSDFNLMHASLPSDVVKCHSLRKLSLCYVNLDENMLQTLLNSCTFIVSLILECCYGFEKIELLNLQKIKSFSIETGNNLHVKIKAPSLEHLSYTDYSLQELELEFVECQNLKSLHLSNVMIANGSLQKLISRSQSLKILKIHNCEGIREIKAPNLVSLEYIALELKITKDSSQLKPSKVVTECYYNNLNAAWFCKLRKFLSISTSWSEVSLDSIQCEEINMNDLQLHHGVATPQVDVLNVNIIRSVRECPTFVDALLWSCHPRRLSLKLSTEIKTSEIITCFMDRLLNMKNSSCSTYHGSNPWHSQLKEVKAYKLDLENQPVELKSGELSRMSCLEMQKIYFLLDW